MSHHGEDHAQGETAHAHPAPGLPEVHDEAGDTPSWVPKLGFVVVIGLLALLAYALAPLQAPASDAPAADEQTEAAAEKTPAE
jgi:hypothetical protein